MTKIGRYTIDKLGNLFYDKDLIIPAYQLFSEDWTEKFTKNYPNADFNQYLECYKILKQKYGNNF